MHRKDKGSDCFKSGPEFNPQKRGESPPGGSPGRKHPSTNKERKMTIFVPWSHEALDRKTKGTYLCSLQKWQKHSHPIFDLFLCLFQTREVSAFPQLMSEWTFRPANSPKNKKTKTNLSLSFSIFICCCFCLLVLFWGGGANFLPLTFAPSLIMLSQLTGCVGLLRLNGHCCYHCVAVSLIFRTDTSHSLRHYRRKYQQKFKMMVILSHMSVATSVTGSFVKHWCASHILYGFY